MPIFSYRCQKCGKDFELLEGAGSRKPVRKCPACGSVRVKKKISGFSVGSASGGGGASSCSTGTCPF